MREGFSPVRTHLDILGCPIMRKSSFEASEFDLTKPSRRKPVKLSPASLVETGYFNEGQRLPLIVRPLDDSVNLISWARNNRQLIEVELASHGAILFRDFNITSSGQFEDFIKASSGQTIEYHERSSPRSLVSGRIYTSTDYPPEHGIFLHNEQSYNLSFPTRIYFFCVVAPADRGQTPLCDTRNVFNRLSRGLRDQFIQKHYMYVRNFGDSFGLTWQAAFQTSDKLAVQLYCRENDIAFEWKERDRLKTRQVRRTIATHPATGEMVWFNHATFFNITTLAPELRDSLLAEFNEEDLPNNTFYGDGSPIEPFVLDELRNAYLSEKTMFDWQERDLLMLDNMSVAHGREPFSGSRRVLAGMSEPCPWEMV